MASSAKFVSYLTLDFLGVALRLFQSISTVSTSLNQIINSHVHIEKFYQLESNKNNVFKNNYKVVEKEENIILNDVDFTYLNSEENIFNNLNLQIPKNSHVVITGPNGSGKSTLLGLIAGIYYPSSDDNALNEMSLNSQVRVAWGGMKAVEKIMNLPRKFGCEDIIFGPKTSFVAIGAENLMDEKNSMKIARKVAYDSSQFEQQGCNAPHTIFVEKDGLISPLKFSEILADQMRSLSKIIPRDPNTIVDIGKVLMLRAKHEMMGKAFYSKGLEWSVLYSDTEEGLAEPCYFRTLFVRPISDVMKIDNYCSHLTQTAGVALNNKRKQEFALRVSSKGVDRIPDVGAMSNYDVPWDGMFMMDRLIRWCKI